MVLDRTHPSVPPRPHQEDRTEKSMLKDLLLTTIRDNIFSFNNRSYRQIRGVAMGTRCTPPFANLFMAVFEEEAIATRKGSPPPSVWLRYLDDIFLVWEDTKESLQCFLNRLNSKLPTIKLSMDLSQQSVDFLDLTIFKGSRFQREGILDIKPFSKPTASFQFLHYRSCHAPQIFTNVVKGEALRTLRNSSSLETFTSEIKKLIRRFHCRGYPLSFINTAIESVTFSKRAEYLETKGQDSLDGKTAVISVRQHLALPSEDITRLLWDADLPFSPMVARKRADNLQDRLVSSSTTKPMQLRSGKCIPWTKTS